MPIEIKELIVRAVVGPPPEDNQRREGPQRTTDERTALVEECVREVLKVLRQNTER